MRPLVQEIATPQTPESLVEQLRSEPGVVLLRSGTFESPQARYSFVTARPFLTFRSSGSRCEVAFVADDLTQRSADFSPLHLPTADGKRTEVRAPAQVQFGNPWRLLDALMSRYELLDEVDLPFPLGGCFGYWGYDLKNFVEPKLRRRAVNDLELPDCHVGFHDSLVVFDHQLSKTWIVSTGLAADGSRSEERARRQAGFWQRHLSPGAHETLTPALSHPTRRAVAPSQRVGEGEPQEATTLSIDAGHRAAVRKSLPLPLGGGEGRGEGERRPIQRLVSSNLSRADFIARVEHAQRYIRAGDIYQANLSHRLSAPFAASGWDLFQRLATVSPAPFAAYLDCVDFQLASSSPELFLRLSGSHIVTRPIKGTRPRANDPTRDAQLAYELQTSAKERAELLMITDLLRNDLGRVCEYGSVQVPELMRLERFAQVQHLVSTVEGRLRRDVTHFAAFASCFPGGSVTGAPKIRAMEIIDELEPLARGPYTGALGYLGFNRESQLSIIIRTALCRDGVAHFNVGAGIVADSDAAAEYDETLAKARGFLAAIELPSLPGSSPADTGRTSGQARARPPGS